MYELYCDHKTYHMHLPLTARSIASAIKETMSYADAAAMRKHDNLYRLFGPEGFVVAISVLGGRVKVHPDVTIPKEHWDYR